VFPANGQKKGSNQKLNKSKEEGKGKLFLDALILQQA